MAKFYNQSLSAGSGANSSASAQTVIRAVDFQTKSSPECPGAALFQNGLDLCARGNFIQTNFQHNGTGPVTITVRALRKVTGMPPSTQLGLSLVVNGSQTQKNISSSSYEDVLFTNVNLNRGANTLRVEFVSGDEYMPNVYDVNLVIESVKIESGTAFKEQIISIASDGRSGLLTRASYLLSGTEEARLIIRGVHVMNDILCEYLARPDQSDPEFAQAFTPAKLDPLAANRVRVANQTSSPKCMACHATINPLGFAFSGYDGFGIRMAQEIARDNQTGMTRTHPVDESAILPIDGGQKSVSSAIEMSKVLSESFDVNLCAAKKLFAFTYGKRAEASSHSCQLSAGYKSSVKADGSFTDFFKSLARDPRFLLKQAE